MLENLRVLGFAVVAALALVHCSSCEDGNRQVCSADRWCWENPRPQGNALSAVWGSGPADVWASGRNGSRFEWIVEPNGTVNHRLFVPTPGVAP